jgi:hypothetical protein
LASSARGEHLSFEIPESARENARHLGFVLQGKEVFHVKFMEGLNMN